MNLVEQLKIERDRQSKKIVGFGELRVDIMLDDVIRHIEELQRKYDNHKDDIELAEAVTKIYTVDEWHEDMGCCLFWKLPVCEPPIETSPITSDWIENYFTHFTRIDKLCDAVDESYRQRDEG